MRASRRTTIAFLVGCLLTARAVAVQPIDYLEFVDAPVGSILVGLARAAEVPIVVGRDVGGTASYFFQATTFAEALEEFTAAQGLYVEVVDGVYRVSTLSVRRDPTGRLSIEAPSSPAAGLVNRVAIEGDLRVIHSIDPGMRISYVGSDVSAREAILQIGSSLVGYSIREENGAFSIGRDEPARGWATGSVEVSRSGDLFGLTATDATLGTVLAELFQVAGQSLHLLAPASAALPNLRYDRLDFAHLLDLILDHVDAHATVDRGIHVVSPSARGTAGVHGLITVTYQPHHLSPDALADLLPPERTTQISLRTDRRSGLMSITGASEDVDEVRALLELFDETGAAGISAVHELSWISGSRIAALRPSRFGVIEIVDLSDALLMEGPPHLVDQFRRWIDRIDVPPHRRAIRLEHLYATDLIEKLPLDIPRETLSATTDPHLLIHSGPSEAHAALIELATLVDRPEPVLRYQLLVVESSTGSTSEWETSISNRVTAPESQQAFLGTLGSVLGLSFDVVSAFGYDFALRMSAAMADASARVLADTVLTATSGSAVEFRNTHTFRYRDASVDPETGEPQSHGITRELTSGLVISIEGTLHGERVEVAVSAGLSRRGEDNGSAANPPTTSERTVRTVVAVRPGEPLMLTGLSSLEEGTSKSGPPLLSRIPILRWFFGSRVRHREGSELAIYLIPTVQSPRTTEHVSALGLVERHLADEGAR